ncbi:MAG: hypothetical protein ABEH56_04945 [Salinirussus sp.]
MGVQPPSDDIDDGPDVVEFGIAALDARTEEMEVSFPIEARRLADRYGDETIPVDAGGNEISLGEAIRDADRREFQSEQDFLNALHPVFEEKRNATSRSILAQLRALVPF